MAQTVSERVREEKRAELLTSAGWYRSDCGWRHPHLNNGKWPWPAAHAVRLQREADRGLNEPAHKLLRGED